MAEVMHYWNDRGVKLIDGLSGLFCTPAGHGRREIREAVSAQLERLDYAPPFQFGTPGGFQLAREIAQLMPEGVDRVFFVGPGSEAVESGIQKMGRAWCRERGCQ